MQTISVKNRLKMDLEEKTVAMLCRTEHFEVVRKQQVMCGNEDPTKCIYAEKCGDEYECLNLDRIHLWKYFVEEKHEDIRENKTDI